MSKASKSSRSSGPSVGRKFPEPSAFPPTYTRQFVTGSTVSFALRKRAIIEEFKLQNVWDLVEMPPAIPGAPVLPIVETVVDSVPPNPNYVANATLAYQQETTVLYNAARARVQARFPGRDAAAAEQRVRAMNPVEAQRDDRFAKESEVQHKRELEYQQMLREHQKEVKDFKARQATCLGVFHSTLSESVRNRVADLLNDLRFREAWHTLCQLYSPGAGGQATIESVYQYYQSYVWKSGTIIDHINIMTRLEENASAAGHAITEPTRIYNLFRSIEQSSRQEFKQLIDFCRNMNLTLAEIHDRLERKSHELETTKEINRMTGQIRVNEVTSTTSAAAVNAQAQPANKKRGGKKKEEKRTGAQREQKKPRATAPTTSRDTVCEHCGRPGHKKSDCYMLKPCIFCNGDHNPLWCTDNPDRGDLNKLRERRASGQVNQVAVPVVTPVTGQQVNLAGRFQALNPRPV